MIHDGAIIDEVVWPGQLKLIIKLFISPFQIIHRLILFIIKLKSSLKCKQNNAQAGDDVHA